MPSFKHNANSGDLIATLAGIKSVCEKLNEPADIYQQLNVRAHYYKGAVHPVLHENEMVMMNQIIFDMMTPLLLSQPYVNSFQEYTGQKVVVNIDDIRGKCFVNIPHGMIQSWPMLCFPDMAADLSKPWIKVPASPHTKGKIIVNFTQRYRNYTITYFFLREFEKDILFTGTEEEFRLFRSQWNLNIEYLPVKDFHQLAKYIKGAKFFLGNQSFNWNLANAMGVPRILELCSFAANCQPFVGPDNYGFYHQVALEYYFRELYNRE